MNPKSRVPKSNETYTEQGITCPGCYQSIRVCAFLTHGKTEYKRLECGVCGAELNLMYSCKIEPKIRRVEEKEPTK